MLKIMLILILIPVQISEELIAFLFQKILNVYNLQEPSITSFMRKKEICVELGH